MDEYYFILTKIQPKDIVRLTCGCVLEVEKTENETATSTIIKRGDFPLCSGVADNLVINNTTLGKILVSGMLKKADIPI